MATAHKVGALRFSVALDNYEPPRETAAGDAEVWRMADGETSIRIPNAERTFKDARNALYLLDDGASVAPHYVAGWNDTRGPGEIFLRPFPVNPDGRTRPDNGRVVDFSTWMLGPTRAYHLKVTHMPECLCCTGGRVRMVGMHQD